jgi:hypothetical protein
MGGAGSIAARRYQERAGAAREEDGDLGPPSQRATPGAAAVGELVTALGHFGSQSGTGERPAAHSAVGARSTDVRRYPLSDGEGTEVRRL